MIDFSKLMNHESKNLYGLNTSDKMGMNVKRERIKREGKGDKK